MPDEQEKNICLVIPEIGESGSSGTQTVTSEPILPEVITPPWRSIGEYTTGLAAERPKGLKEDAARILGQVITKYEYEAEELKQEIRTLNSDLRDAREDRATYLERIASLKSRLTDLLRERRLKNATITVGTLLMPIAYNVYKEHSLIAIIVALMGLLLIIIGWHPYSTKELDR